jgi:TonB family protein
LRKVLGNNINGILGTIAFHMLLLILFLLFRISDKTTHTELIEMNFDQENPQELLKKLDQLAQEKAEKLKILDQMADGVIRRNIAVNVNDKTADELSTDKFIKQFADENKLEGFKKTLNPDQQEVKPADKTDNEQIQQKSNVEEKPAGSKQIYKGPTNIYCNLESRRAVYVPVPVYKCEGSGKVVVEITVDNEGTIIGTSILKKESNVNDECLFNTAISYASITRFNADPKAASKQNGSITYFFIPQH